MNRDHKPADTAIPAPSSSHKGNGSKGKANMQTRQERIAQEAEAQALVDFVVETQTYARRVAALLPVDPEADALVEGLMRRYYASRGEGELL